jgi:anti-anti-sigma factor
MPLRPSVQTHLVDGHLVAEFWDCLRLDPAPVQALQGLYDTHLRGGGKADLVIDLNGVTFAGSSALGGFLKLQRVASKNDGRVAFCHVDPNVMDVFHMSNLENYFLFLNTRDEALNYFATPQGATATEGTPAAVRPRPASSEGARGGPLSARRKKANPDT